MRGAASRVALVAAALVLAACASAPRLDPSRTASLPQQAELHEVPFIVQAEHYCGPASLATVLQARGMEASQEELARSVYLPTRKGSLPLDMLGGARRAGALAIRTDPTPEAVLAHVAEGYPVVVLQNLALDWVPRWHYAVVVGYDLHARKTVLRSGDDPRQVLDNATFDATWARSGRWAMIVAKPGEVPAAVSLPRYTESVIALERAGRHREALTAYEAGLAHWPDDLTLAIGAGNTAYALKDLEGAEAAFRRAAGRHPESDAALNNLAHVLSERGAFEEAAAAAERAIALDGPNREVAEATLKDVRKHLDGR